MTKRVIILLLISGLLSAQQSHSTTDQQPCPKDGRIPAPGVSVYQRHGVLRRGHTDDLVVVFCYPQRLYGGCGYENHPPLNGIVPVSFRFDSQSGVTISIRKGRRYVPLANDMPTKFSSKNGVVLLRITAEEAFPLGKHSLHGSFQYEINAPEKARTIQTAETDFQLTVVEHDAKAVENDWPFGNQVGRHIKDAALAPLIPFEYLLLAIACSTSQCDL